MAKAKSPASSRASLFPVLAAALAALSVCAALWALTREWDKPLLDLHSFRQTQTAIFTDSMVGNPGVFLGYETPVLGKPWAIPMEVPLYQWLVARWHELTRMGLDPSGKLVSIDFLLAGLLVLFSEGWPKRKDLAWLILAGAVAVLPIVPGKLWLARNKPRGISAPGSKKVWSGIAPARMEPVLWN